MKKLFILLFVFVCLISNAQKISWLITDSPEAVKNLSDSAAYKAKTKFVYNKSAYARFDTTLYVVHYVNGEKVMNVCFIKVWTRKGVKLIKPLFVFDRIEGALDDLFPFYQSMIDNNVKPGSDKYTKIIDFGDEIKMRYSLSPNLGGWQIQRYQDD